MYITFVIPLGTLKVYNILAKEKNCDLFKQNLKLETKSIDCSMEPNNMFPKKD